MSIIKNDVKLEDSINVVQSYISYKIRRDNILKISSLVGIELREKFLKILPIGVIFS